MTSQSKLPVEIDYFDYFEKEINREESQCAILTAIWILKIPEKKKKVNTKPLVTLKALTIAYFLYF